MDLSVHTQSKTQSLIYVKEQYLNLAILHKHTPDANKDMEIALETSSLVVIVHNLPLIGLFALL